MNILDFQKAILDAASALDDRAEKLHPRYARMWQDEAVKHLENKLMHILYNHQSIADFVGCWIVERMRQVLGEGVPPSDETRKINIYQDTIWEIVSQMEVSVIDDSKPSDAIITKILAMYDDQENPFEPEPDIMG